MAVLGKAFDASQHEDMNSGFEPLPKGDYVSVVKESDIKVTAKKTGKFIKLKFEVISGEFKGRFFWNNINFINPNDMTEEIAAKELGTLCRACGIRGPLQDTKQLHGKPIIVSLKITPANKDYPPGNAPTGYVSAVQGGGSSDPAGGESGAPWDGGEAKKGTPPGDDDDDDGWPDDEEKGTPPDDDIPF